jgi:small redox-active disulfide protein 2
MNVKILGSGCVKCQRLYAEAARAVAASGVDATIEKVEDFDRIVQHGVMMTPALVIDDRVKASGRVPPASEIAGWLEEAASAAPRR